VPPQSEPYSSRRDTVTFVVCLLLAVAARMAPLTYAEAIASSIRNTILFPFLRLQEETEQLQIRRVQFDEIAARADSAAAIAGQLQGLEQENARLRAILGLRARMPVRHVAAEVLLQTQQTEGTTIIVSAGEQEGVLRWAPVVALGGLVGNVQTVDRNTAVVHTWTHPDFSAAVTALNDSVVGLVGPRFGEGFTMMLELRGVAYGGDIPQGTPVYTSGLGGVYPRGLPVGRIRSVLDDRVGWSRSFLLEPAVHPAAVSHVLILLAEGRDLSNVFEER
jgi:rod shape-determining protein MreC